MILPLLRVLALTTTCNTPDGFASYLGGVLFGDTRLVPLSCEIYEVKGLLAKRQALLGKMRGAGQTLV